MGGVELKSIFEGDDVKEAESTMKMLKEADDLKANGGVPRIEKGDDSADGTHYFLT